MNTPNEIALCMPEHLDREELIAYIRYLQGIVAKQSENNLLMCDRLTTTISITNHVVANLGALIDAHEENDQEAIAVQLQALSERRKAFRKPVVH
jgi:hypothetical protein